MNGYKAVGALVGIALGSAVSLSDALFREPTTAPAAAQVAQVAPAVSLATEPHQDTIALQHVIDAMAPSWCQTVDARLQEGYPGDAIVAWGTSYFGQRTGASDQVIAYVHLTLTLCVEWSPYVPQQPDVAVGMTA